jgi:hypothetical protein
MKYVGKAQVIWRKNFTRGRFEDAVKILAKNAALATVSSSGCDFFCNFSIKRKVNPAIQKYNSEFKKLNFDSSFEKMGKKKSQTHEVNWLIRWLSDCGFIDPKSQFLHAVGLCRISRLY